MESDIDNAADQVIGITNALGAAAANVQTSRQALNLARGLLRAAAKKPETVAAVGASLLAISAGLSLENRRRDRSTPS